MGTFPWAVALRISDRYPIEAQCTVFVVVLYYMILCCRCVIIVSVNIHAQANDLIPLLMKQT